MYKYLLKLKYLFHIPWTLLLQFFKFINFKIVIDPFFLSWASNLWAYIPIGSYLSWKKITLFNQIIIYLI